jgi:hypothetical protein
MRFVWRPERWSMVRILQEMFAGPPDDEAPDGADREARQEMLTRSLVYWAMHGNAVARKLMWHVAGGPPEKRVRFEEPCIPVCIVTCKAPAAERTNEKKRTAAGPGI